MEYRSYFKTPHVILSVAKDLMRFFGLRPQDDSFEMKYRSRAINIRRTILNICYQIAKIFGIDDKTISILCYHGISDRKDIYSITKEMFASQMEKISQHAKFISLSKMLEVVDGKEIKGPMVSLTFDDGYANVLNILPVIKKYKIPVTLFVLSDPQNADRYELDNKEKLLNWEQIKYLHSQGWEIGCHSATHSDFKTLTDEKIEKEITDSKKTLEKKLGFKINYFAYPKGVYNQKIIEAVKKAGYKAAFAAQPGTIAKGSNDLLLPRTLIDSTFLAADFPAVTSTMYLIFRKLENNIKDKIYSLVKKNDTESKPSMLQIILGGLVTKILPSRKPLKTPRQVGKYSIYKKINKKGSIRNFAIGVYKFRGKKYFIKTWKGKIKNLAYYSLLNEYLICKLLHSKLALPNSKVLVPKTYNLIKQENSMSVVFEFIEGKNLLAFSLEEQKKISEGIISVLNRLSKTLREDERQLFTTRSYWFYLISLPYLMLLSLYSNPRLVKRYFRAFFICLKSFYLISKQLELHVAHRDLIPENIKIFKSKIYLLDCENMVLTIPEYDESNQIIFSNYYKRKRITTENIQNPVKKFLVNYISIHRSGDRNPANCYTKFLYKTYA